MFALGTTARTRSTLLPHSVNFGVASRAGCDAPYSLVGSVQTTDRIAAAYRPFATICGADLFKSKCCARLLISGLIRLYLHDVGIGACSTLIVSAYSVIISRLRTQPDNVVAGGVSDVQILITGYVSSERVACGYVQPITGCTADTLPLRGKAGGSHIGCILCLRSCERRAGRRC